MLAAAMDGETTPAPGTPTNLPAVRIIYFALVGAVLIYGGLIQMVSPPGGAKVPYPVGEVILGVALLTAAAALFVRYRLAAAATPARALNLYVLSFALAEAPAIFGLVLHFLGGSRGVAFGLVFTSLAVLFLCYPRRA
jgi:hypothetical protein